MSARNSRSVQRRGRARPAHSALAMLWLGLDRDRLIAPGLKDTFWTRRTGPPQSLSHLRILATALAIMENTVTTSVTPAPRGVQRRRTLEVNTK
jgi:hypothetical protein